MILLDGDCIAARSFFGIFYNRAVFEESLFVPSVLRSLLDIIADLIAFDSRFVLCLDSRSWRRDVYADYKNKPKACDPKMYAQYKEAWNSLASDIKASLPIVVQKREGFEADDLVALNTAMRAPFAQMIIVSQDKDLVQLLKFPNVRYWNFVDRNFVTCHDVDYQLHELICLGDKSDNVPGIVPRNPATGKPLFPFGEVTVRETYIKDLGPLHIDAGFLAEKMKKGKMTQEQLDELHTNYMRNKTLIDLMEAPWLKKPETVNFSLECRKDPSAVRDFFGAHLPSVYINEGARIDLLMHQLMECKETLI